MLSMPPATTMWELPVWMACWARATAFSPEPQTLLMVMAETAGGQSAAQRRLPRRILSQPGLHHVAHDAFIDRVGIDARALHRLANDNRAQLRRGEIRQRSLKLSYRSAHGGDDNDIFE